MAEMLVDMVALMRNLSTEKALKIAGSQLDNVCTIGSVPAALRRFYTPNWIPGTFGNCKLLGG